MTTIISWNVNGLQGILKKNADGVASKKLQPDNPISNLITSRSPDILCLQEIRCSDKFKHAPHFVDYPYQYTNYSKSRKGYSGTLVASKIEPLAVYYDYQLMDPMALKGLPEDEDLSAEGRIITLEFENYYLVNVYTPNSGVNGFTRLDWRTKVWDPTFRRYIRKLMKLKEVIVVGDLNIMPTELDTWNNNLTVTGSSPEERHQYNRFSKLGLIDAFRDTYPAKRRYSWTYSNKWQAKTSNGNTGPRSTKGFRMDFTLVTPGIKYDKSKILSNKGSDHFPVRIRVFQ